jgi:PKD repeat protein
VTDSTGAKASTTTTVSPSNGVTAVITSANCSGLNCSFDGSGSSSTNGSITDYSWNFGDGTSTDAGSSPTTTHTYASGGTYTVTLTVTDSTAAQASTSTKVSPAAATGTGTLTVSPTSVSAGSSGHTFTFAYTSPQTSSAAHVLLDIQVPAGWTAPQHTSSTNPGYVRVNRAGCTWAKFVSVAGSGPWTIQAAASCPSQTGFRVSYGGGGTKVTAPSSPGGYPFTGSVEVSPATTFEPFASQPTVTVH